MTARSARPKCSLHNIRGSRFGLDAVIGQKRNRALCARTQLQEAGVDLARRLKGLCITQCVSDAVACALPKQGCVAVSKCSPRQDFKQVVGLVLKRKLIADQESAVRQLR